MQSVECAVKLTTTASGRIAGLKWQIGEALYTIAGRKKQYYLLEEKSKEEKRNGKKHVTRKAAHASQ